MDYVQEENGSLRASPALVLSLMRQALAPFGDSLRGVPGLKASPISDFVLQRQTVVVPYDDQKHLLAHLRHTVLHWAKARILAGQPVDTWIMTDPRSIVDAAFGTSKDYGGAAPNPLLYNQILTTPLLVIRAAAMVRFRGPQEQITYVLRLREDKGLPTVFCYPTTTSLWSSKADQNDPELIELLTTNRLDTVELEVKDLQAERKPKRRAK